MLVNRGAYFVGFVTFGTVTNEGCGTVMPSVLLRRAAPLRAPGMPGTCAPPHDNQTKD